MGPYLTYLAPPLVGAFIGYMTNYVAIRMLFRPLRPWKFLGIRVPMTPGVIPSKRHDLAQNIGKMVGTQLLTSNDVQKALNEDNFKHELKTLVDSKVKGILTQDLGALPSIIPDGFKTYFDAGVKILRWRSLKIMHSHLDNPYFAKGLANTISLYLKDFLAKDFNSTLSSNQREHIFSYLDNILVKIMADPKVEEWLNVYIDQKAEQIISGGTTLKDLIPDQIIDLIFSLVEDATPGLLEKAAKISGEPEIRGKFIKGICDAISSFVESLGPMAALASSFLTPDIIEAKVVDFLGEKSETLSEWLNNEIVQQRASKLLKEKITGFINQPVSAIAKNFDQEKLQNAKKEFCRQIIKILQNPHTTSSLTSLLREAIEAQSDRPAIDILSDIFGNDGIKKGVEWTTEEIINIIRSPKVKRIMDTLVVNLVEKNLLSQPIGALANFLPKAVQSGFGNYLLEQTSELLVREVPGLVDSLNIQQIVTKKVDSLDLLKLEGLLLSIMEEQFKYINLFGGLLGFVIGLLNLIFIFGFK